MLTATLMGEVYARLVQEQQQQQQGFLSLLQEIQSVNKLLQFQQTTSFCHHPHVQSPRDKMDDKKDE